MANTINWIISRADADMATFIKKDNRIKLFKQTKNQGAGVARNVAIKHAKGNYIAFEKSNDNSP